MSQFAWYSFSNNLSVFVKFWALFAVGILITQYKHSIKKHFAYILMALGVVLSVSEPSNHVGGFIVASALVFVLIHHSDNNLWLAFKPLSYLGVISYSVYIWHYLMLELVMPYIIKEQILQHHQITRAVSYFIMVLLISYLSYQMIERPFMYSIRKKLLAHVGRKSETPSAG